MGRPRKKLPEGEKETLFNNKYVKEVRIGGYVISPHAQIHDPKFGHSRPAPKPSQMKKTRGKQEESDE